MGGKLYMKEGKDMNSNALKKSDAQEEKQKYSYDDLLKFTDEKRYEIINGELFVMESPSVFHQEISLEIASQIKSYLKGKKCKVFSAPLDVKISGEKDNKKEHNVVQPDIFVVCDENKIKEKNILGAPDLIIEILSPSTVGKDQVQKLNLYQKYGVREYWIVSQDAMGVMIFILNDEGKYTIPKAYYLDEKIKVNIFKDLYISLDEFIKERNYVVKKYE